MPRTCLHVVWVQTCLSLFLPLVYLIIWLSVRKNFSLINYYILIAFDYSHLIIFIEKALIFSAKDVCTINFTVSFYLYLYLQPRENCDHDIYSEMKTNLVFCFLSCLVKFPVREANSWRRRASRILAELSVSFFLFFSLLAVLTFFHDQMHTLTQTRKVRRDAERPKRDRDRERFASLDLWITD